MAFSPIDIPIQEILETDFIVDIRTINNSNFLLLKDKVEDVVNNLEIDTNALTIGTDSPITYIKTDSVIMEDTGFILQTGTPTQIISRLSKNSSDESVLNVDILEVDVSIQVAGLDVNSALILDSLTVDGATTFNASVTFNSEVIESKESINLTLDAPVVPGPAEATITLTNTSRQNIFVTLDATAAVYPPGGPLVPGLSDISLTIYFDLNNPPDQNMDFTIYIVNVRGTGGTIDLMGNVNSYAGGINLKILPGTNLSTTNTILLHSDFATSGKFLGVPAGATALEQYNSLASLLYIVDGDGNDRIMIKSLVEMEIY